MADIKRILVPTDFSEPADAALTYALGLASKLGAEVSLVHVFDDPSGIRSGEYVPLPAEMRGEILADLRRRLADVVAKHGDSQLTSTLLIGPTARSIVEGAPDSQADLIVMGTHGAPWDGPSAPRQRRRTRRPNINLSRLDRPNAVRDRQRPKRSGTSRELTD